MSPKKVMIVEDHEEMQILYKAIFRKEQDLQIVSQEENAENAIKAIPELKPDLVVIDISLPGMTGIELTQYIRTHYPEIKILVVTAYEPERYFRIAKEAGADNLVTKTSAFNVVIEAKKLLLSD